MAVLTAQNISRVGLVPAYVAAAGGGDTFVDDASGRLFVHVKNASGGSITVTLVSTAVVAANSGLATANLGVAVAAGSERMIGPVSTNFINPESKVVSLTYSGVTSLTIGVFKLAA